MVLPFNIYSYKSMRAMQAIQPQLQAVRERYKDDNQAQQLETMKLMREDGCTQARHFWMTWLPFWSATHSITRPCSSCTSCTCHDSSSTCTAHMGIMLSWTGKKTVAFHKH